MSASTLENSLLLDRIHFVPLEPGRRSCQFSTWTNGCSERRSCQLDDSRYSSAGCFARHGLCGIRIACDPRDTSGSRLRNWLQHPPGSATDYYSHIAEMEVMVREPASFDVDLTWIAPGDDEWFGTANRYELYHATHSINNDNYDGATVHSLTVAAPAPGGMIEVASALNLGFETTHYFALKTFDEAGNASGLSNNAMVVAPPLPPAPITDLRLHRRKLK